MREKCRVKNGSEVIELSYSMTFAKMKKTVRGLVCRTINKIWFSG